MTVVVGDLAKDKCYATLTGQVRRIVEIDNETVKYESRGKKAGTWNSFTKVAAGNFAAAVEREVSCDYDPNFSS